MSSQQQRTELHNQIWRIADDVRGAVDGWDFKQYVLGALFYRFISENFSDHMEGGEEGFIYADVADDQISDDIKHDVIKVKGYFIYPSQLFGTVLARAEAEAKKKGEVTGKDANRWELNTILSKIFSEIEGSARGFPSEDKIKGLFADFDVTSSRLGNTVVEKNVRLLKVLQGISNLKIDDFASHCIDLFGDAYEFLISKYAANAGKSGGEFFTPQNVSKLIARLVLHGQKSINKVYDPACGSGSLLLQVRKQFKYHKIEEGYFGQEINHTTYNLARMNMFLHEINYDEFSIKLGDTLCDPHFGEEKPFDAIVSNPPYSIKWIGSDDSTLINDDRFAPAGVLAPKSKADFAFVLHALNYLSSRGRAVIVCFPGIFYRGGVEKTIRRYLIDNNYIEAVIALAPNLFYGTSIAVNLLLLSKNKKDTKTQFIDASKIFDKKINNNELNDNNISDILRLFVAKKDKEYLARSVDVQEIKENDYTLSVSSYIEAEDTREVIDIKQLNKELRTTVATITGLRTEIDDIIAAIEGDEVTL